jgi:hypothetical protein
MAKTQFFKLMARPVVARAEKKCFQVNEVCLLIWRADPRVVHIGKHRLQPVDHALKRLRGIGQPKRKNIQTCQMAL